MKKWARILGLGSDKPAASPPNVRVTVPVEREIEPEILPLLAEETGLKIEEIAVDQISPNPFQPRKTFTDDALQELSQSIREFGVLQPLLARRQGGRLELIAGERRLRASRLAGLHLVPVIVKEIDDREMAELAMIENLQREDLHFLEEAEGFQQLLTNFGFTQEALAARMGKSQSTIANKLRLLRMSPAVRTILFQEKLTERHARALLKLDEPNQRKALETITEKDLNVRETEELVARLNAPVTPVRGRQNVVKVIRDVRIFLNTVNSVVGQMRKSGMDIRVQQQVEEEFVTLQIQVRNNPGLPQAKRKEK